MFTFNPLIFALTNTQFVMFYEAITFQICCNVWKFPKNRELLIKIQQFRHEWSSIMYENAQKKRNEAVTSGIQIYQNVCFDQTHILLMFSKTMSYQT